MVDCMVGLLGSESQPCAAVIQQPGRPTAVGVKLKKQQAQPSLAEQRGQ